MNIQAPLLPNVALKQWRRKKHVDILHAAALGVAVVIGAAFWTAAIWAIIALLK